jgi:hypothetical protein
MQKRYFNSILPKIWIILVLLVIFNSGCNKDFFDKQPLVAVSDGTFWKTELDANLALIGCYNVSIGQSSDFWTWFGILYLDLAAGNGADKGQVATMITNGSLTSSNSYIASYWKTGYVKIATCNNFLDHIGNITMDASKKAIMIAEVRTIRAYEYFNLALYFGDVPLVQHLLTISEANSVIRAPKADVWAFAEKELAESCAVLPVTRPNSENGRITSGAALAILGRLQMAEKKWSDAVITYKKIIDNNCYIIDPKYAELFWEVDESSKEIILATQYQQNVYANNSLTPLFPMMSGGGHQYSPYNNLVKIYECTDGKTIDQSPLYDPNNPYNNRDPRLDYSIMISDRTVFQGKTYISRPGSGAPDDFSKYGNENGYSINKSCDANVKVTLSNDGCNLILIRYAEVLLSYLESKLESGVTIDQALLDQTINMVRGRAAVKMPPVTTTAPAALRVIVRRERRVEFAFEGLRYYDILRWGIAANELTGIFTGMKLTNDPVHYTTYPIDNEGYYKFETKNFKGGINELWPIPQSELDINKNLTQNTGY